MYKCEIKDFKKNIIKLEFETAEQVFQPTGTSEVLIKACQNSIKAPGKILDLGCGIGFSGLVIAKLGLCVEPLYASDISKDAIDLAEKNAELLNIKIKTKCGSLFEPWEGERFDYIIDDVSGISEEVARISPWFPPGVTCDAGKDGTRWIAKILEQAPNYLNPGGVLFFPILSLSDEGKILSTGQHYFSEIKLLRKRLWHLPKEMEEKIDQIKPLISDGIIAVEKKYGGWLWTTKIFSASNPKIMTKDEQ